MKDDKKKIKLPKLIDTKQKIFRMIAKSYKCDSPRIMRNCDVKKVFGI